MDDHGSTRRRRVDDGGDALDDGSALLVLGPGGRWWRRGGAGAEEDDAEAEGEVGVDGGVLDLVKREARQVPDAHGDLPGLADPGVPEEPVRHLLDGGVPHAGGGAELHPARHVEAVVVPQHAAVVRGARADEGDPGVGEEPAQRLRDGVGAGEVEHEAAVADAELERGGDRGLAAELGAGRGPLHAEADDEVAPVEEAPVEPARGGDPAPRVGGPRRRQGREPLVVDADRVGVVVGRGAAEARGDGDRVVHGGGGGGGGGGVSFLGFGFWTREDLRKN